MRQGISTFYESLGPQIPVPAYAVDFPSMTTKEEKELLYRLARQHFTGEGVIIDAGLFLGASTNAFAWGIKERGSDLTLQVHRPINAYEIAIWHSAGFDKYLENPQTGSMLGHVKYNDGDDYSPLLRRLLSKHEDLIDFKFGDIVKLAAVDKPVEIAFYDCLKSYERDWAAFKAFGPHFIVGHTVVVQQDYFYEDALDNKIRQEFLSPYFEFLGAVSTSAVFRLVKPIPPSFFAIDPLGELSVEQSITLLDSAARRIPLSACSIYAELGVVRYMIGHGEFEEAAARLDEIDKIISATSLPPRPATVAKQARDYLVRERDRR